MGEVTPSEEPELFDLNNVLKYWAYQMYETTATKEQKNIKEDNKAVKYIWDDVTVVSEEPSYHMSPTKMVPGNSSLFSTSFINNSDEPQEYNFSADRSTTSSAEVELQKGYVTSKSIGFALKLPQEVAEANVGFSRELSLSSAKRQAVDEQLSWGVNTTITVKPLHRAEAVLRVEEQQKDCNFTAVTTLRGKIRAVFTDTSRDNCFVKAVEGDIGTVIDNCKRAGISRASADKVPKVWTTQTAGGVKVAHLETTGSCRFRYGVKQVVEVDQRPL